MPFPQTGTCRENGDREALGSDGKMNELKVVDGKDGVQRTELATRSTSTATSTRTPRHAHSREIESDIRTIEKDIVAMLREVAR